MNPLDYEKEIERVLARYAFDREEQERDDLRQECRLALIRAGEKITGPALAYSTCRNRVLDIFKSLRIRATGSLSDPSIQAEVQSLTQVNNEDRRIDLEGSLAMLSAAELLVIRSIYGLGGDAMGNKRLARHIGKSERWVRTKRKSAIKKLRSLFGVEVLPNANGSQEAHHGQM